MNLLTPRSALARRRDRSAVERYARRLREAPDVALGHVHTVVFAELTPRQQDLVFEQFLTNNEDAKLQALRTRSDAVASMNQTLSWYLAVPYVMQPAFAAYLSARF